MVCDDPSVRDRVARALESAALCLRTVSADGLLEGLDPSELLVVHSLSLSTHELALLRQLKRAHVGLRVIVVCDQAEVGSVRRAVDVGVGGVILADRLEAALAVTVAAVLAGQTVVPAELGASLRRQPLSFREKQILGLVALGLTNSQIGARLFLAESTVKSHLSSSFSKLGVASRNEAAALILDPQESLGLGILQIAERAASGPFS